MASDPPNWDGSTEAGQYVPPHRGSSLDSLLEETGEAEEVREMVKAKQAAPPEYCPPPEEAPVLWSTWNRLWAVQQGSVARELWVLRQKWMREARAEALAQVERMLSDLWLGPPETFEDDVRGVLGLVTRLHAQCTATTQAMPVVVEGEP
jgi:hypothetical protein